MSWPPLSLTAQPFGRLGAPHSSRAWEGPGAPHSFRGCFPTVPPGWAQWSLVGFCRRRHLCTFQLCSICAFWLCMTGICLSLSPDPYLRVLGAAWFLWFLGLALLSSPVLLPAWAMVAAEDLGWGQS